MKYRLLDLFCGAGGCTKGYQMAGFYVVGVDNKPQPHYCGDEFYQADALEYCREHGHKYDAIHASPPCQKYSWAAARWKKDWPDLVAETRDNLNLVGKPFVMENVTGAPLRKSFTLCGTSFGLKVIRHRVFECNWNIGLVPPCWHNGRVKNGKYVTVAGHGGDGKASCKLWKDAMQINWMTKEELTQAIPPAYTEFIGRELIKYLNRMKYTLTSSQLQSKEAIDG